MKTISIFKASRVMAFVFAAVFTISVMSCGSNGGDDDDVGIVGTWVRQDGTSNASYAFYSDGKGLYQSGGDVWGDFKYNCTGMSVYIQITYVNNKTQAIWRRDLSGRYNAEEDRLNIEDVRYIRKH